MNHYDNHRSLLVAVILQAVRDARAEQHQADVNQFFHSNRFQWMWDELTDDLIGMQTKEAVINAILAGHIKLKRSAYHSQHVSKSFIKKGIS